MSKYKLQVFKPFEYGDSTGRYRFVIIDASKTSGYPTNFVCVLPKKFHDSNKPTTVFVQKFGYNIPYAVELIKEAIKKKQDALAIVELQKRLKTLKSYNDLTLKVKEILPIDTYS